MVCTAARNGARHGSVQPPGNVGFHSQCAVVDVKRDNDVTRSGIHVDNLDFVVAQSEIRVLVHDRRRWQCDHRRVVHRGHRDGDRVVAGLGRQQRIAFLIVRCYRNLVGTSEVQVAAIGDPVVQYVVNRRQDTHQHDRAESIVRDRHSGIGVHGDGASIRRQSDSNLVRVHVASQSNAICGADPLCINAPPGAIDFVDDLRNQLGLIQSHIIDGYLACPRNPATVVKLESIRRRSVVDLEPIPIHDGRGCWIGDHHVRTRRVDRVVAGEANDVCSPGEVDDQHPSPRTHVHVKYTDAVDCQVYFLVRLKRVRIALRDGDDGGVVDGIDGDGNALFDHFGVARSGVDKVHPADGERVGGADCHEGGVGVVLEALENHSARVESGVDLFGSADQRYRIVAIPLNIPGPNAIVDIRIHIKSAWG